MNISEFNSVTIFKKLVQTFFPSFICELTIIFKYCWTG